MKKIISILVVLMLLLSLAACGSDASTGSDTGTDTGTRDNAQAETQTTEEPQSADARTADAKTADPTPAPTPKTAEEKPASEDRGVAGYYKMTYLAEDGEEEDFGELDSLGLSYYLVMNEDGTCYLEMLGERDEMTWDDEYLTDDEGEKAPYSYADDVITMEEDGLIMKFTRLTDDEQAYYEAHGSGSLEGMLGGLLGEEDASGLTDDLEELDGLLDDVDSMLDEWGLTSQESDIPEGDASAGPVKGTIGDYDVTILGAEALENDGEPVIRFWYDFTNHSDSFVSASSALFTEGAQNGMKLSWAYTFDSAPEEYYANVTLAPGRSIRCVEEYGYDPDGGLVAFRLQDWDDELIYYADPQNLSGAPEDSFVMEKDDGIPAYVKDLETAGNGVEILRCESAEGYFDDEELVRIYYSFTNETDEETSFFMEYDVYVLQDGYGLFDGYPEDDVDEDDLYMEDIAPGETIVCSCVYEVRGDSPLVVIVEPSWNDNEPVGAAFEYVPD